ncbi:MAG: glycosyltransferase, partial [Patescibacteria group bacterium]
MREITIMFTGGGTAGHVIPVLTVAGKIHELKPSSRLVYVIERNNPNEHLVNESQLPIKVHHIFAGKYRRFHNQNLLSRLLSFKNNLLNLRDVLYFAIGFVQSLGLLLRYRPAVLFSKGGYVSAPVSLAAALLRVRFVTHDSDSVPGIANRLSGRYASKNAVGVEGAKYPYGAEKIIFTGVPVSDEYFKLKVKSLESSKKALGLSEDAEVLLIGGSTQGAKIIDDSVEKIVPRLLKKHPKL